MFIFVALSNFKRRWAALSTKDMKKKNQNRFFSSSWNNYSAESHHGCYGKPTSFPKIYFLKRKLFDAVPMPHLYHEYLWATLW